MKFLKHSDLLAMWKPDTLADAMATDPTPYCNLAQRYADEGNYRALAALYYTITDSVEAKYIHDGPMFPHRMETFFDHKRQVVQDLMQAYRIHNVEY